MFILCVYNYLQIVLALTVKVITFYMQVLIVEVKNVAVE